MQGYKVVRRQDDDRLTSVVTHDQMVTYRPGTPSVPEVGKLFAFDDYDHAVDFLMIEGIDDDLELWLAELVGSTKAEWILAPGTLHYRLFQFWNSPMVGWPRVAAPPGTVTCEQITLLKRLELSHEPFEED